MQTQEEDWHLLSLEAKHEMLKKRNYRSAYKKFKYLADHDVYEGVFWCAFFLERGWLDGHIDFDRAQSYYEKMRNEWGLAEGSLGCARIILARGEFENRRKAIDYCFEAMSGISEPVANILLGRIAEELTTPPDYQLARKTYLEAARQGSYWAVKKYAQSLRKSGNLIGSTSVHILSFILWSFYLLMFGKGCARGD